MNKNIVIPEDKRGNDKDRKVEGRRSRKARTEEERSKGEGSIGKQRGKEKMPKNCEKGRHKSKGERQDAESMLVTV